MTEDQHQVEVRKFLDRSGLLWCHVPNGGHRNPATASRLLAIGVKAGVPDILIFTQPQMAIEMKKPGGKTSPKQREWLQSLENAGWHTRVCFGHEDAIRAICEHYGVKP